MTFRINFSVIADGGYIGADDQLEKTFPDLEGSAAEFRQLLVSCFGTLYNWAEFKLSVDFANVRDIKDQWVQFTKIPHIGHVTLKRTSDGIKIS